VHGTLPDFLTVHLLNNDIADQRQYVNTPFVSNTRCNFVQYLEIGDRQHAGGGDLDEYEEMVVTQCHLCIGNERRGWGGGFSHKIESLLEWGPVAGKIEIFHSKVRLHSISA